MDGFEACRQLRQREATRTAPIIMVTTCGGEKDMEIGFESGCNDYVTKPVDGAKLLAKFRSDASDLFGLGVILYESLTGQRPFGGKTLLRRMAGAINDPVIPPQEVEPG